MAIIGVWKGEYRGIFDVRPDRKEAVEEVLDVLEVWQFLEPSYANLSEEDKERVKKEAKPFGEDVVFPGFDGNNEGEYLGIAQFMIDKMGWFTEFRGRNLELTHSLNRRVSTHGAGL